jgi:hypothetical protein
VEESEIGERWKREREREASEWWITTIIFARSFAGQISEPHAAMMIVGPATSSW